MQIFSILYRFLIYFCYYESIFKLTYLCCVGVMQI